ncbi:HAD superfamily hydrolase-like protein [Desulfitobacterium hafniense DCB-2]|uniref:HAD superfamily hydrolase-like protein n=1 Tax=Desulfitobacterium hafniense (strain DSM 10664 / DCB-2) TaxID=272564 RepID=B8FTU3_DESHD|nr:haloacid dehalogenase [Desulfitobacterium hafniense]ACL22185.1 HAD superfamily hydrolase-like protein [Desulfitobacterium hafniense DCB-2]
MLSLAESRFLIAFEDNFSQYKKQRIALYGIGEKTKLLLEHISGYDIVGLMDKDAVGNIVYGYNVLSYDDAIKDVELIIIVANISVSSIIYQRIAFLCQHGIEILYINGKRPEPNPATMDNDYWDRTLEKLKSAIDKHDVISFDLFDTLIMRRILMPANIFDLIERELAERFNIHINFKICRIEAEKYCFANIDRHFTMEQIYNRLQETLCLTDEVIDQIKSMEYEFELKYCTPRHALTECFNYAVNKKKKICITTDMYWNSAAIKKLLKMHQIAGYENLFISCELKMSKTSGTLWEYVKEIYSGKSILHIGDNRQSDIDMPRKYNISTFEVKSAYDLMSMSVLNSVLVKAQSINDCVMLGQFAGRFLNSPFAINKGKGRFAIDNAFDLGYVSFGPLVLGFILWLIRMAKKNGIDKLLFFARDGYILEKIYRKLVDHYNLEAPQGIYFLISRRAASVAALKTKKDVEFIVKTLCKTKKIKIRQLLLHAFGVYAEAEDLIAEKYYYELSEDDLIDYILYKYQSKILINAHNERTNYLNYLSNLNISKIEKIGVVNFVGRGVTQHFLRKLLIDNELTGYYFAIEYDALSILGSAQQSYSYYPEMASPHIGETNLAAKYLFGEVVFSSPDEQLIKFDKNNAPIFDAGIIERNFSMIQECHRGIEQYIDDMVEIDKNLLERTFDIKMVDEFYGMFSNANYICSNEVKRMFVFSDYYNPGVQNLF